MQAGADRLPVELWFEELLRLGTRCARDDAGFEERAIRQAHYLAELCPVPFMKLLDPALPLSALETLLEDGRFEEAAQAIVRQQGSLSVTPVGKAYAAELIAPSGATSRAEAGSPVLAAIGAWARLFTASTEAS